MAGFSFLQTIEAGDSPYILDEANDPVIVDDADGGMSVKGCAM